MKRIAAAVLCFALLSAAPHKHPNRHPKAAAAPIALFLNDVRLSVYPPPRFYEDHLMVPVRRILAAMGLSFEQHGRAVDSYAGSKTIRLMIGSSRAYVDDQAIALDAPVREIKDVLYAPLRFFTEALDAQASFDRSSNSVRISSSLLGRNASGKSQGHVIGTITTVDQNSDPQTITLTYNDSVRTLALSSHADVVVKDVNTGTVNAGDLSDVHVGDWAEIELNAAGHAKQIVDAYGSRSGKVAAAAAGQIVLDDGHVIVPSSATTITLNGNPVAAGEIAVGDSVTERYNIDTFEPRQVIATRQSAVAAGTNGVAISSVNFAPQHPLREKDRLFVTLHGTPGGLATFNIGGYVENQPLRESAAGVYSGSYTVPRGVNFPASPVIGHLNVHNVAAPPVQSDSSIAVSTEAPGVADFAPGQDVAVSNPRPSIYVTFTRGAVPVNPSSEHISVNGHDVTSESIRGPKFLQYIPGVDYGPGPVTVVVRAADEAGNSLTKSWTFRIK